MKYVGKVGIAHTVEYGGKPHIVREVFGAYTYKSATFRLTLHRLKYVLVPPNQLDPMHLHVQIGAKLVEFIIQRKVDD